MAIQYVKRYAKYFYQPLAESFEEGFWDAVKRRELAFQRCARCGEWLHPPRPMCHKCKSFDLEWVQSAGRGRVYSWVTFTREVNPFFGVPFDVVLVEMDQEKGVRFVSNLVDCSSEEIRFDMPVEVVFVDVTPEHALPLFRPAAA